VFRFLTDEEVTVWANYCLHDDVPAMSRSRMWRATNAVLERAA
jgi:nitrite reductase/ring-hydroxylating ferredoxin subunit